MENLKNENIQNDITFLWLVFPSTYGNLVLLLKGRTDAKDDRRDINSKFSSKWTNGVVHYLEYHLNNLIMYLLKYMAALNWKFCQRSQLVLYVTFPRSIKSEILNLCLWLDIIILLSVQIVLYGFMWINYWYMYTSEAKSVEKNSFFLNLKNNQLNEYITFLWLP
jgi:hypothetical protein